MKCSEGLSNRVSNVIRRCINHMKLPAYMAFSFITYFLALLVPYFIIIVYTVYVLHIFFNFLNYVFLFLCLCILIVMYVLFCIFCFHCAN